MPTKGQPRLRPVRSAAKMAVEKIKTQRRKYKSKNDNKDKETPSQQKTSTEDTGTLPEKTGGIKDQESQNNQEDTANQAIDDPERKEDEEEEMKEIFEDEISEEEEDEEEDDEEDEDDDEETEKDSSQKPGFGNVRFNDDTNYSSAAAHVPEIPPSNTIYRQRRIAIMVKIPEVDNNADRLHHLVQEVNEFIKMARKKNRKFRLRKFDDDTYPNISNRSNWRTSMNKDSVSDFREYIQGYYPFTPPRGGNYRLRINTVMDNNMSLPEFIENVMHDWGQKDARSVSDIKAQRIWDPVKIGYMMRASRYLTHSFEFVDSLEAQAQQQSTRVHFGVSWGTIPSPVGGYDRDTAVQAVILETNRETKDAAVALMKKWYPLNPEIDASPPYPGPFRFVINKDNERVRGNPVALANLSILMERQGIFNQDTRGDQSYCLKDINMPYKGEGTETVRDKLLDTKISTMGEEMKGSPLFLSISTAVNNRTGTKSVWFTYHKQATAEALSVIQNLPVFIKQEWKINPEYVCYAQFIQRTDEWDAKLRVANNEETEAIRLAAELHTLDLQAPPKKQANDIQDESSMNTKAQKEMQRMLDGDAETIVTLSQAKQINPTTMSIEIDEDQSQGVISGVSSKSSIARAKMQKEFDRKMAMQQAMVSQLTKDKEEQNQRQEDMLAKMTAMQQMIQSLQQDSQQRMPKTDEGQAMELDNTSGQETTESPQEGYENEDEIFMSHVDDNYKSSIAEVAAAIIAQLENKPTSVELEEIYGKAKDLVDEMDERPINVPLPASPASDQGKIDKPRLQIAESEESEASETSHTQNLKRLLSTSSDETEDSKKFVTTRPDSPKKKTHATGSVTPDRPK